MTTTAGGGRRIRIEDLVAGPDWRHLARLAGVRLDLRYAGTRNFAGRKLYGTLDCAWLRCEAAEGLEAAAAWLAVRHPGWRLLVLDALRPQRVQEAIWRDIAGTPAAPYFADPALGSIHSYGMAVDLTLLDPQGGEADMGTGFDAMTEASHPALHAELLARGVLSAAQVQRRDWLREALAQGGFSGIDNEWWHFNHGDPERVRRELPRVD
jgi:D-alanyl-D-alanine dipeptidase